MKKLQRVGLILIVALMMVSVLVSAIDSPAGFIFFSETGGGNITFTEPISYDGLTWVDNQTRFTNLTFGSYNWGDIGFRAPNTSVTMNVDNIRAGEIVITTTQTENTTYKIWLPAQYEPIVVGADSS